MQPTPRHHRIFVRRFVRNFILGIFVIGISLGIGMLGYRYFEAMSWVDAYLNAAMILSGMGPVASLETVGGKLFAGSYALFSGIIFLVVIALVLVPIFHHFFHQFHLEEGSSL